MLNKFFVSLSLFLFAMNVFADSSDIAPHFQDKDGCFILYDVEQNKIVTEFNPTRCAERVSPNSTFKVPISLMAFDQGLITQDTIFKWDGADKGPYPHWNQDQTPQSWLQYSVVWVSQEITTRLGMEKIKKYLKEFDYGNQDFTGDPGKNNGLTHAWLSSSLKISGNEQLQFIKRLVNNTLPISKQAMANTVNNMYLETSPNGWKLYGKSGSGDKSHEYYEKYHNVRDGLFVGFVQKDKQTYIFITNFTDLKRPQSEEMAGPRAKAITKEILSEMNLY